MTLRKTSLAIAVMATLSAGPAVAHSGHIAHDLSNGLLHPFMGADHLLAMLGVGLWAATREVGKAWRGPAVFLVALGLGGLVGLITGAGTAMEMAVGGSVIGLSLLLFAAPFVGERLGLAMIGIFALLHGHAHGTEAVGILPAYFMGFIAASAALHLFGWKLGHALFASRAGRWLTALGLGGTGFALALG